jgi:hypothetical protein
VSFAISAEERNPMGAPVKDAVLEADSTNMVRANAYLEAA